MRFILPTLFLLLINTLLCHNLLAQYRAEKPQNNNLYIDGGIYTKGLFSSVNYERRFFSIRNIHLHLYGKVGLGFIAIQRPDDRCGYGPNASLNFLIGRKTHFLELETGGYLIPELCNNAGLTYLPNYLLGFRYQSRKHSLLLKGFVSLRGLGGGIGLSL